MYVLIHLIGRGRKGMDVTEDSQEKVEGDKRVGHLRLSKTLSVESKKIGESLRTFYQ